MSTGLHLVTFLVDGDRDDVRELVDELRRLLDRECFPEGLVRLVRGPKILASAAVVDAAAEEG